MAHYPFVFQATVGWMEDAEYKHYRIAGIGFCEDYTDAVRQIEAREGDCLDSIEHVEIIGERNDTIVEIDPDWVRPLIDTEPWDLLKVYTPEGK